MENFKEYYAEEIEEYGLQTAVNDYIFNYISDRWYIENLTCGLKIARKATKNIFDYFNLSSNNISIENAEKLLNINNYNDLGIVEDVANGEFEIDDNSIKIFEN